MGLWEKGCLGVVGGFCVVEGVLGRIVAIADCLAMLRMAKKGTANATAGSFDCAQERLSTAQFAKSANCIAQDDKFLVGE
jgi:hypothetical protein